jgi:hypothetical protein
MKVRAWRADEAKPCPSHHEEGDVMTIKPCPTAVPLLSLLKTR